MKKIITLLLLIGGFACAASAQMENTGFIRVAFTDPSNEWKQSNFCIYVFGGSTNEAWPGTDVTNNTKIINGHTYYYRDIPTETYGTGFKVIFVNRDPNGNNQSQSVDISTSYDNKPIKGDCYYTLLNEWDNDKRKVGMIEMYYIVRTTDSKVVMADNSNGNHSVSFKASEFPNFLIANSYAFSNGTLDWSNQKNNMYRPSSDKALAFIVIENGSDCGRNNNDGSWATSGISDCTIDMTFTVNNWNVTTYGISPYFERTLKEEAEGYATFSYNYDVTPAEGLTVKYVSAVDGSGNITWDNYPSGGIKANQGVLLQGTPGTYRFTPSTTATAPGTENLLKPIDVKKQIPQSDDNGVTTNYILTKNSGKVGFFKVNSAGSWCAAGTAYLSTSATSARGYFPLWEDATSIEGVVSESENVNLPVYDLQGRRVTSPQKGLYIVNGKKVVIK